MTAATEPTSTSPLLDPDLQWKKPERVLKQQLDKEAFLQLLVAQMRYQDPSSPMDMTDMMAQTSALGTVEKLTELAQTSRVAFAVQQRATAGAMIGQQVSWIADAETFTGVVDEITFTTEGVATLHVGDHEVEWDQVAKVSPAPAAAAGGDMTALAAADSATPAVVASDAAAGESEAGSAAQADRTAETGDAAAAHNTGAEGSGAAAGAGDGAVTSQQGAAAVDAALTAQAAQHVRETIAQRLASARVWEGEPA